MATIHQVSEYIQEYNSRYRSDNLTPLAVSDVYDLFPDSCECNLSWPNKYPNGAKKGVYIIMDASMNILYIGKASMNHTIENRLSAYFCYSTKVEKTCKIRHDNWSALPRYLSTIGVEPDLHFEAPAIEEYLIKKINPPYNKCGKYKK